MEALILAGAGVILVYALGKLLDLHCIHSLFWPCAERTNTNRQTRFENLRRYYIPLKNVALPYNDQDVVTFEFGADDTVIEIPRGSAWCGIRSCRRRQDMCRSLEVLSGTWYIEPTIWWDPAPRVPFPERPGYWRSVGRPFSSTGRPGYDHVARARLSGSEHARQVDHVLASAIQDAELYFRLCSTPLWIRALYWLTVRLSWSPAAADTLARRVLWIQLRTIFFRHDVWEYRGYCKIFEWRYPFLNKPDWVKRFEKWSAYFISRQFLRMHYLLGTLVFGMRAWYPEYELLEPVSKDK
ncbi:hypothetical protein VTK56DRAFT_2079 [Thermocarpiscus australiensis]